jgi:hypothetical protein
MITPCIQYEASTPSYQRAMLLGISQAIIVSMSLMIDKVIIPMISTDPFLHIAFDSFLHGCISILSWISFVSISTPLPRFSLQSSRFVFDCMISYIMGTFIDIDHFLAAKSFSLSKARMLPTRPLGHCFAILPLLIIISNMMNVSNRRVTLQLILGYTTHMLRDSCRRGLWLLPSYTTSPFPYAIHLLAISLTTVALHILMQRVAGFILHDDMTYRRKRQSSDREHTGSDDELLLQEV